MPVLPSTSARLQWAKSDLSHDPPLWHPLPLHLLDVAATADALLAREPEATRAGMASTLGLKWQVARPWLLLLIACHDLGKACPGFQCKWKNLSGLDTGPSPDTSINHAFVSQIELARFLSELGWPASLAELAADAVGCHHGERAKPKILDDLGGNRDALGKPAWEQVRRAIFDALLTVFAPGEPPSKPTLTGPDFMLLAGLTSFADWLGSNQTYFPFGAPEQCDDLAAWFSERRRLNAEDVLDRIGWAPRLPLAAAPRSFADTFGFQARPLQDAVAHALNGLDRPSILLVEAPMGEGKTEAAFYAHLELQRRFGHRGLYVALPTKATGNAMFRRTLKFLAEQRCERTLDLQLLHGGALLNDEFQSIRPAGIHDSRSHGGVRAGEWFTHKKRALLSEYGVGTVDQALLTILPVRHQFVRLWGLANRVVVLDEIHAYDDYTGTLLLHLLRWLLALGSSVLLLSATLPVKVRRKLSEVTDSALSEADAPYPRLSVYQPGRVSRVIGFEADAARRLKVQIEAVTPELTAIRDALSARLDDGGYALTLVNTVQRAQDLYRLYGDGEPLRIEGQNIGKRLADGTEIYLFHARFPADQRQRREDAVLRMFGPPDAATPATRSGRKILIATQVAEQSLDLDFDLIVSDLAPIDLLLQRAGRLWRHRRGERPLREPLLIVAGLPGSEPPPFGKPLWWSAVYREDVLLRTWCLLQRRCEIVLPQDIDPLVQAVYEELVPISETLQRRLDKAMETGEGTTYAQRIEANKAVVGRPDTAEWNDPARYVLYDEDEPGIHRTLMAQTRLGDESVIAIPLREADAFDPAVEPPFAQAKDWFQRSMSLPRKSVVKALKAAGVPAGWKKSPLLRNAYPLRLDAQSCWIADARVRLDDDLGLLYERGKTE